MAKNPLGAKPGDRVVVASDTGSILGAAALVYLLPILLFFVGYFAVGALVASEGGRIAVGGICFILALAMVVLYDRRVKRRGSVTFSIVEICRD